MRADYNTRIRDKKNEYRSMMNLAEQALMFNGNKHSLEECRYLQSAADICSELAQMSTGIEREHYMEMMNSIDRRISIIRKELERYYNPAPKKPAPAKTPAKPQKADEFKDSDAEDAAEDKEKEVADKAKTKKKEREAISDEEVAGWFKEPPKHGFDQVSGMEGLKQQLKDCIEDSQDNLLRQYLKMKALHSYFFIGPPGCGKTHIVGAFAHEMISKDYKYISIDASDIKSKYVGDAEKIVKRLFSEAIANAPCIVFVDEVDSICKSRKKNDLPEYAYSITTAFLTGFNDVNNCDENIIFIGATNYPQNIDSAVLDRVEQIYVPLPDRDARAAAFERHMKGVLSLAEDLTYDYMADATGQNKDIPSYNYRDIDRLMENIKAAVYKEVKAEVGVGEEAVQILSSGQYALRKEIFDKVLANTLPSDKRDIIEGIEAWMKKVKDDDMIGD